MLCTEIIPLINKTTVRLSGANISLHVSHLRQLHKQKDEKHTAVTWLVQLKGSCVVLWQRNASLFITSTHASKHLLAEQHRVRHKGEPTHMHKHSDACGVMQDNSGFADSLLTTGMWEYAHTHTHTHTHRGWGWQVWRSMACYSCSQRSQAAASQGDEGEKSNSDRKQGHNEEENTCCDPEAHWKSLFLINNY